MPARLHTAAALLALFALALPAGATAVSAMDFCVVPCEEGVPCDSMPDVPGHETPDAPAHDSADCCLALDSPLRTEVVVPEAERPVDLSRVTVARRVPAPQLGVAPLPAGPPLPSLRTHLAFAVLLI